MTKSYPVTFFVFKRPKYTYDFLSRMYDAGIKKIYVFADGPRNASEKVLTDAVRSEIERFKSSHQGITLITHFAARNAGLRKNIIKGLNTVFKYEEAAIIIEDDCLPSPDFFRFTASMLTKYHSQPNIMSVNGMSVGGDYEGYSYGFTKYPQCWGWATWARAWNLYDENISKFSTSSWSDIAKRLGYSSLLDWYWRTVLETTNKGKIATWDYQWTFAHFYYRGLAISPSKNLVSNIGFDSAATNTKFKTTTSNVKFSKLKWPLIHPKLIMENITISKKIEKNFYVNYVAVLGLLKKKYLW